jgi:acetyl esterase/lipase
LHVPASYPPTFITVGDADPFQSQAMELESALKRNAVLLTTLFWTGTGDHLNHEYQFNFNPPAGTDRLPADTGVRRHGYQEPTPWRTPPHSPAPSGPTAAARSRGESDERC